MNEQEFVNLYYKKILIENNKSFSVISELYKLAFNKILKSNCQSCLYTSFTELASYYVALIKKIKPEYETSTIQGIDDAQLSINRNFGSRRNFKNLKPTKSDTKSITETNTEY